MSRRQNKKRRRSGSAAHPAASPGGGGSASSTKRRKPAAHALLSRHDASGFAVAVMRAALAGTECKELSEGSGGRVMPKLLATLPQVRALSSHAATRTH